MAHQLSIGKLDNQCLLYGEAYEQAFIHSELRHCTEHRLQAALSEEIDRQLSSSLFGEGYYRIKQLNIDLTLKRTDFSAGELSKILAAKIVFSLKQKVESHQQDIQFFSSEADFIAEFISDLLKGRAWNHWQYDEFKALQHISASEAAAQLLLARWQTIADIIYSLNQRRNLYTLIRAIDERQARNLMNQWRGQIASKEMANAMAALQGVLRHLDARSIVKYISYNSVSKDKFVLFLHCIQSEGNEKPLVETCFIAAEFIVLFAHVYRRHKKCIDGLLTGSSRPLTENIGDDTFRFFAEKLIDSVQSDSTAIATIQELVNAFDNQQRKISKINKENSRPKEGVNVQDGGELIFYSPFAGLSLLVPTLLSLKLYATTSAETLRNGISSMAEGDDHTISDCESWLKYILPDLALRENKKLEESWHLGISQEQREKILGLDGIERLKAILLTHFSARLSGMQHSSNEFIYKQFLHRPGKISVTASSINILLEPIPLYIVLQISGFKGWNDILPWQDKMLKIDIAL